MPDTAYAATLAGMSLVVLRVVPVVLLVLGVGPLGPPAAWSQPAVVPTQTSAADEQGAYWPLDPQPEVVSPFQPPADPWGAGHRGVDLAGHPGQVVRSALAGTVSFAGSVAGKPVVTVDHGGRRTTYEPVVATVSKGAVVGAGDPIGRLVVLHGHCLPVACLHWGLVRGDTYLDPLSLVGGGPVRLLPLWRDVPAAIGRQAPRAVLTAWRPPLAAWRPPLAALSALGVRLGDVPAGRRDAAGRW